MYIKKYMKDVMWETKKWVKVEVGKISFFITNFCRNIALNSWNSHLRLKVECYGMRGPIVCLSKYFNWLFSRNTSVCLFSHCKTWSTDSESQALQFLFPNQPNCAPNDSMITKANDLDSLTQNFTPKERKGLDGIIRFE